MRHEYTAAVAAPLRGPKRLRDDMLAEIDDGFAEAVAEREAAGLDHEAALAEAAVEFGEPDVVAAEFQRELAAAQARRTAWTILTVVPALTIMWDLFSGDAEPGLAVTLLARLTDLAAAAAFTVAALVVAKRLERRAAVLCGAFGLAQIAVALGCSVIIAAIADEPGSAAVGAALMAASVIGSAWIAASSVRAVLVGRATP